MSKKITLESLIEKYEKESTSLLQVEKKWLMVELGDICDFKRGPFGSAITKSMFVPQGENTFKVYEQGNAIRKTVNYGSYHITAERFNNLKGFSVSAGDIIVSCAGTIGETFVIPEKFEKGLINQALLRIRLSSIILTKYFLYAFDFYIKEKAKDASQGTAIKNLPPIAEMKKMRIALPPIEEQKRIIERVERLLKKIEEAQQLIAEIIKTVDYRRAATLEYAFKKYSGDNYTISRLKDYTESIQYGYTESASTDEVGPKFLRITDIQNDEVNWGSVPYCPVNKKDFEKYKLGDGDIVVARTGATTGKSYLIESPPNAVFASYLIRIRCREFLNPNYLWSFMKSSMYWKQIMIVKKGSAQPGANATILGELEIPIPSIENQLRIVKLVEGLLEKYKQEQYSLNETLVKIDFLKKSILSKAFKGELGTNNSNDQPVIELLKSILREN